MARLSYSYDVLFGFGGRALPRINSRAYRARNGPSLRDIHRAVSFVFSASIDTVDFWFFNQRALLVSGFECYEHGTVGEEF